MKDSPRNTTASIAARLRNVAYQKNIGLEFVLRRYAIERFLHRLVLSSHGNRFILKGAMLFTVWMDNPFRPTLDLDLLGFGDPAVNVIADTFRDVCRQASDDDGLRFDGGGLIAEPIRDDQDYGGVRIRTTAFLGNIRIPLHVDVGFGDAITPAPTEVEFPALLAAQGPHLRAYPRETVIAEKFQALVELGLANSRMKDFYDLFALSRLFPFDGTLIRAAIVATFERRQTMVPEDLPIALSIDFASDHMKSTQWAAFLKRTNPLIETADLQSVVGTIAEFLMPPVLSIRDDTAFAMDWPPSGPWALRP